MFYQEIINEWVEAGNKKEDFTKNGAKIVVILDNASFHKKAEYIEKIEAEMPMPTYLLSSLNLNIPL